MLALLRRASFLTTIYGHISVINIIEYALDSFNNKVYVTFATFATLGKIDLTKQGLLVIPRS